LHINELSVDILRTITAHQLQDLLRTIYDQATAYHKWWSRQDAAIPKGNIMAFAHGQLLSYAYARANFLYPQLNFGVFSLTSSAMLAWQDGAGIFSAASGGLKLALIDSSFGNGKLYMPGGQITELFEHNPSTPVERGNIILFALMLLEPISHSPSGVRSASGAAVGFEAGTASRVDGKLQPLSLANGSPSKFKHTLLAPDLFLKIARKFDMLMWAVCGGLYNHTDFDVEKPSCPACAEGVDVELSLNSRAIEVGMTLRLLEYVGEYARREAVFHVNAAAITIWLSQGEVQLATDAGDRCFAALKEWLGEG
jgi:hypothetical protein